MVKSTFQIAKHESLKKKKKSKDRNASPVEFVKSIFKKKKSGGTDDDNPRIVSVDATTVEDTPRTEGKMTQNRTSDEEGRTIKVFVTEYYD